MIFSKQYWMLRRMGYLSDQKGIQWRYQNEKKNWDVHINNTKQFIVNQASLRNNNSVAVLGSGWLLDVPLDFLASYFKKVYLFDVFHPQAVREKAKKYRNVHLVRQDISGGAISECYRAVKYFKKNRNKLPLPEFDIRGFSFTEELDCVISINILNQLDILSLDHLIRYKIYTDEEITSLRKLIQQKHIDSLPANKTILISDHEEIWYDSDGKTVGGKPLVFVKVADEKILSRWIWVFDTNLNYYPDRNVSFRVMAATI
jgi:hypothetical protein